MGEADVPLLNLAQELERQLNTKKDLVVLLAPGAPQHQRKAVERPSWSRNKGPRHGVTPLARRQPRRTS